MAPIKRQSGFNVYYKSLSETEWTLSTSDNESSNDENEPEGDSNPGRCRVFVPSCRGEIAPDVEGIVVKEVVRGLEVATPGGKWVGVRNCLSALSPTVALYSQQLRGWTRVSCLLLPSYSFGSLLFSATTRHLLEKHFFSPIW